VSERALIAEGLVSKVAERLAVLGQVVLRLVEQLAGGAATPQELADALGLTQQNVSKHLQILHRSGVVTRRPEGANVIYSLNAAVERRRHRARPRARVPDRHGPDASRRLAVGAWRR